MTENEAKRPKIAVIGCGRNAGRTLKAHIDLLEKLEQYRAIGTVEEFKALKEKAEVKKPIQLDKWGEYHECPVCGKSSENSYGCKYLYCPNCGCKYDWSE